MKRKPPQAGVITRLHTFFWLLGMTFDVTIKHESSRPTTVYFSSLSATHLTGKFTMGPSRLEMRCGDTFGINWNQYIKMHWLKVSFLKATVTKNARN